MSETREARLEKALELVRDTLQGVSPAQAVNAAATAWSIARRALSTPPEAPPEPPTPEPERPAERCVDMGALDALLAYGHDERDSALRDLRREDYVQWSGWVDALERLKARSLIAEDTHAGA